MGTAINSQADNKELVLRIENCLGPLVYYSAFLWGLALSCLGFWLQLRILQTLGSSSFL